MVKRQTAPGQRKNVEGSIDYDVKPAKSMEKGRRNGKIIEYGLLKFSISHSDLMDDQGVTIRVYGPIGGIEKQLLRFDCFDHRPHYHYDPDGRNEMHFIDLTTAGNPLGFAINNIRTKLPVLLENAGAASLVDGFSNEDFKETFDEVETFARELSINGRRTVTHNRGDTVIGVGNIKFGLEYRNLVSDGGMAIHVLGDVAGQEIELLAFDCFKKNPHYHYGPRNKNIRIYWDKTMVPNTLDWTFKQFKYRRLGEMINRAGYPGIASELDEDLIAEKIPAIEKEAWSIVKTQETT